LWAAANPAAHGGLLCDCISILAFLKQTPACHSGLDPKSSAFGFFKITALKALDAETILNQVQDRTRHDRIILYF